MIQSNELQKHLKNLGIRTPVDLVREAIQRLKNGESAYSVNGGEIMSL